MFKQLLLSALSTQAALAGTLPRGYGTVCIVEPAPRGCDSAPTITEAFQRCGVDNTPERRGRVVFRDAVYDIQTVLNTTGLRHVDVEMDGTTLLWDTNIPYWLNHSLPVGYQNQTSAWHFGGEDITWTGFGTGTLDGNGQVWYDFANGTNNYPGRPHQLTITGTRDSVFEGLRFVQSQMWTMTVIHSENVLLENIYVNSTDTKQEVGFEFSALNTDGADTIYANNITFRNWTVDNGDDSISMKANSTNILIEDCKFYTGLGIAIGSIGQYAGAFEIIENVTARNIEVNHMRYGAYVKTWTGVTSGYPPNGGGGGFGYASNILFSNFTLHNVTGIFAITQCTSYNDVTGNCDTSEFNLRNMRLEDWSGDGVSDVVASVQCSAASPCEDIEIEGINIVDTVNNTAPANYLCDNVVGLKGFECTGLPWEENNR